MKCYFRSFDVGIGDCNIIRLVKEDGSQYSIMVDCGSYTESVNKYLKTTLKNHIDLLIATHIDNDHIAGISTMLKNHPDLKVDKIWYNCYRCNDESRLVELNDQQKKILLQIKKEMPLEFDAINYREINASKGRTLAQTILENETLKKAWTPELITMDTPDYDLPTGFGKIIFLSPEPDALKKIDQKFKDTFDKYFMQQWDDSLAQGEELNELLIRLADTYQEKFGIRNISFT